MRLNAILLGILFVVGSSADLHQKVRYFETLGSQDLNVVSRTKRSADGSVSHSKQISFQTLGRRFNLVLFAGSPVLSPNFRAKTIASDGKTEPFNINLNNFYTGHLADDSEVSVAAHFEDGVLSSSIHFHNDTYVVEPAWRHRMPSENHTETMISYRGSDVNWEEIFPIDPKTGKRTKMRDGIRLDQANPDGSVKTDHDKPSNTTERILHRHKRAVAKNTCPLLIVADYSFFRDMGNKKRETTASFLISSIQNVNRHYNKTVWDSANGLVNMGFQIDEMLIHTDFTNTVVGHYNYDQDWDYNQKLYAFSRSKNVNKFCLAHLFTSYPFQDNVLGLAFIAPESISGPGGICSVSSVIDSKPVYPRTGWSSAKNTRGHQVLSLQYELVTTHELGHNWGAEHDPDTDECAPTTRNDGKFIMWAYAVPGYDDNNKNFSPCSRRNIAPVLRSKSSFCFREFIVEKKETNNKTDSSSASVVKSLCGNGQIEKGEECDVGFLEENEEDPCCDKQCQLKNGAVCSDFNYPCCRNCQVANASVVCEQRNPLACREESICDGRMLECPVAGSVPDNTTCIDSGKCFKGKCLNFCALLGQQQGKVMTPCLCVQNTTAMCRRCCMEIRNNINGDCLPTEVKQQSGRTCLIGSCNDDGECVKVEQQLAHRIFNFIENLTVDKLVEFMKDNIVGTVIVLSLVVWVPASWIVSCVDKRKVVMAEDHLMRWASRENQIVGNRDLSNFQIKNSRFKRLPQQAAGRSNGAHDDVPRSQMQAPMDSIKEENESQMVKNAMQGRAVAKSKLRGKTAARSIAKRGENGNTNNPLQQSSSLRSQEGSGSGSKESTGRSWSLTYTQEETVRSSDSADSEDSVDQIPEWEEDETGESDDLYPLEEEEEDTGEGRDEEDPEAEDDVDAENFV